MQKNKKGIMSKLLFLTFITGIIITNLTLSKFHSTSNSNDKTQVAIYAVNAYSSDDTVGDLVVDCAGEDNLNPIASCTYEITNQVDGKTTEVTVGYKVKVDFGDELPTGISIAMEDENGIAGKVTKTGNSYVFENEAWVFTPETAKSNNVTLNFMGENSENATSATISNVQVSVLVEQIN